MEQSSAGLKGTLLLLKSNLRYETAEEVKHYVSQNLAPPSKQQSNEEICYPRPRPFCLWPRKKSIAAGGFFRPGTDFARFARVGFNPQHGKVALEAWIGCKIQPCLICCSSA